MYCPECTLAGYCLELGDDPPGSCICFQRTAQECFDDFDADELGLDPEDPYDA